MGVRYRWRGVWNPGGPGWYEWFAGIPCRDLTDEDLAQLPAEALAVLESPTGQRLYEPVTVGDQPDMPAPGSRRAARTGGE